MLDARTEHLTELSRRWREAQPFPHVILDNFVSDEDLAILGTAAGLEPYRPNHGEIFEFFGSEQPVQQPALTAFIEQFGGEESRAALKIITGHETSRLEMRSYFYGPGHYLLPHLDHQVVLGRKLAVAYYLVVPEGDQGGELELFEVELNGRRIVNAKSHTMIQPRANRMVIFEVSDRSLHQVREVLGGTRLSLAGWFY